MIDVNQGSVQENLLQLIQTLGEYLTNDDGFVRAKGNNITLYKKKKGGKGILTTLLYIPNLATGLLSTSLTECRQEDINESAGNSVTSGN